MEHSGISRFNFDKAILLKNSVSRRGIENPGFNLYAETPFSALLDYLEEHKAIDLTLKS